MAALNNTRNLSRRATIAGLAALSTAGAAAALSMPASAAVANPDAELIAACKEWLAQEQRCNDAFHIVDALSQEAKAKEPNIPYNKRAGRAVWAAHDAAEKAADDLSSGNWDRLLEICDMPAHTIAGLHAKMTILAKADALQLDENIGGCLLDDVARLAGAVRS